MLIETPEKNLGLK